MLARYYGGVGRTRLTPEWTCRDCGHTVVNPLVITRCPKCGGRQGRMDGVPKSEWPQITLRIPPDLEIGMKTALDDLGRSFQQFFERAVQRLVSDPRNYFKGD